MRERRIERPPGSILPYPPEGAEMVGPGQWWHQGKQVFAVDMRAFLGENWGLFAAVITAADPEQEHGHAITQAVIRYAFFAFRQTRPETVFGPTVIVTDCRARKGGAA